MMWRQIYTSSIQEWIAGLDITLCPWQWAAIEDTSKYKLILHGRRVGASTAIAVDALRRAHESPGSTICVVSTNRQTYHLASAILNIGRSIIDRTNGNDIYLRNGSRILVTNASEASTRGLGMDPDGLYIDNSSFHDNDILGFFDHYTCPVWVNYNPHMRGNEIGPCDGFTRIVVADAGNYTIGGN